jgi:DNA-directed RNA polymerase specialized sigma24 family protein
LVSGEEGRTGQRGVTDEAYERYVRRLARNVAKDLFRHDPKLLRALIDKPLAKPLMFPAKESELPIDEKRLGRFKRRFKRLSYRDRFLLRLVVIDTHTIAQIADQTKVSFADATTRLFKLFARLRP